MFEEERFNTIERQNSLDIVGAISLPDTIKLRCSYREIHTRSKISLIRFFGYMFSQMLTWQQDAACGLVHEHDVPFSRFSSF